MSERALVPAFADVALGLLGRPALLVSSDRQVVASNPAFQTLFPDTSAWLGDAELERFLDPKASELVLERDGKTWTATPVAVSHMGDEMTCWVLERAESDQGSEQKSRDEFISMIVHDLRGPAAGIRGTLDFLLEDPEVPLPTMHRDFLEEARDEAQRMMNLVGEILDFTKIRAGRFQAGIEKVRTEVLVRRAILAVRSLAARERIALEADVPKPIAPIAGNADKLLQVLNNLLVNAFKFSASGSLIVVSARELPAGENDHRVCLAVTDTGPGIDFAKQDELFAKFADVGTATDKKIAGTGLGLFITKAIVEALGGTIAFASIPKVGTSFFFELPAYEEPSREEPRGAIEAG